MEPFWTVTIGNVVTILGEIIIVGGGLFAASRYIGKHDMLHENVSKELLTVDTRIKVAITPIKEDVEKVKEICEECNIDVIEDRQITVLKNQAMMDTKLDKLIERTSRIERVEAKIEESASDRTSIRLELTATHLKLDRLVETVGEVKGILVVIRKGGGLTGDRRD